VLSNLVVESGPGRRIPSPAGLIFVLWLAPLGSVAAQTWNPPDVLALVRRATARRLATQPDSGLQHYKATAHGLVFFLAQVGSDLTAPPRLVKADELGVEVYWQAPGLSKQIIHAWRDGRFLPTDINYHRDHLGIVTNNFGGLIRIGEGDEVRDAVHPLAPSGGDAYDFAMADSLTVRSQGRVLKLYEVLVRPRDFARPLVVGRMYLDAVTADLVRFRFSFTPVSYLDRAVEDISVVLENALVDDRYWLPWRQEIEIRRRVAWLDFPARSIIRGRWEIGDYDFDAVFPGSIFVGEAVGGLHAPMDTGQAWPRPLAEVIAEEAAPINHLDMEELRHEVERVAGAHALEGLPSRRLAGRSVSDFIRVNRVQGLAIGIAGTVGRRTGGVGADLGYGTSNHQASGGLSVRLGRGAILLTGHGERRVLDVSDFPVISPALNSVLSQEAGQDHGDYYRLDRAGLDLRWRVGTRTTVELDGAAERAGSMAVAASPISGSYRVNPGLGTGTWALARLSLEGSGAGFSVGRSLEERVGLDLGTGPSRYARATALLQSRLRFGPGELLGRSYVGWGSADLPAYRSFLLGGRGTLPGESFRAYGGRSLILLHAEWRFEAPFPAIPLGAFASTGHSVTLAPFVAAGWTDRAIAGTPWTATAGIRPVAGLAAEFFLRLIRVEAGVGLRTGRLGVTVDVSRAWWGIL
jgi:hypothetical protein